MALCPHSKGLQYTQLQYRSLHDAVQELDNATAIGKLFVKFQKYFYKKSKVR